MKLTDEDHKLIMSALLGHISLVVDNHGAYWMFDNHNVDQGMSALIRNDVLDVVHYVPTGGRFIEFKPGVNYGKIPTD